jgi:predicted dehydrogenase
VPVRAGVVGLGFGEKIHVPGLRRAGAEVVAVCARNGADEAAERLDVPRAYAEWHDLVADPGVELVSISSPPVTHHPIALAALAAGKPVLCEKPMAVTLAQAEEMAAAARAAGVPTLVDFEFTAVPAFRRAKELVAAGEVGAIEAADVRLTLAHHRRPPGLPWKDDRSVGGGALLSLGVHSFDYLTWLVGPVTRARGTLEYGMGPRADSGFDGELEHASGARSRIHLSVADDAPVGHVVTLRSERGTLSIENRDLGGDYMREFRLLLDGRPVFEPEPTDEDGRLAPFVALAARLVQAIETGGATEPSFEAGLRAQRLAAAIEESHASGGAFIALEWSS